MECDKASSPLINNIKVRVTVDSSALAKLKLRISELAKNTGFVLKRKRRKPVFSQFHNFIVYRSSYIYTIFANNGAANITGIPSFEEIDNAIVSFCQEFHVEATDVSSPTIDNLTASGDFKIYIDLQNLKQLINISTNKNSVISSACYNTGYFPACFCKTFSIGTVAVFGNGKYNIVGAKCLENANQIFQAMIVFITKL
jgi:TATA-box binding protein (TBP) (component of TFIID and TFIIIB)